MAIITPIVKSVSQDDSVQLINWTALTTSDSGAATSASRYSDKTVQMLGTFSVGGSVTLEGTNQAIDPTDPDASGNEWFPLTDPQGNAITKTAGALEVVTENPLWIRPRITAGDGSTAIDCILLIRINNNLRT